MLRNREAIVQEDLDRVKARLRTEKDRLEAAEAAPPPLAQRPQRPARLDLPLRGSRRPDRDPHLRRLRRPRQPLRVPAPARGARRDDRRPRPVPAQRHPRDGRAGRGRPRRDRREEGRARPHPLAARGPRGELDAARDEKAAALDQVEGARSSGSRATSATSRARSRPRSRPRRRSPTTPLPAGPIQGGAGGGMIWPVNGPVTSPFGWRWGRMHEGVDIGVPAGHADPGRAVGQRDPRRVHGRLRQLHVHRPRRRAVDLLRPPVELRDDRRRRASIRAR